MNTQARAGYWAVIPYPILTDKELRPNAKLLYGHISSLCNAQGCCTETNEYFAQLIGVSRKTASELIATLVRRGYIRAGNGDSAAGERRLWLVFAPEERCSTDGVLRCAQDDRGAGNGSSTDGVLACPEGYRRCAPQDDSVYPEKSGCPLPKNQDPPPEKSGWGAAESVAAQGFAEKAIPKNRDALYIYNLNNNNLNKEDRNNPPISPRKKGRSATPEIVLERFAQYAGKADLLSAALYAFAENRAAMGSPMRTERTAALLLSKLDKLSGGDTEKKVALLEEATLNGWKSVYPLHERAAGPAARSDEAMEEWT